MLGTPSYMSPEQAAGAASEIGPRSDIYSLGVILYELMAGRPPFGGSTPEVFAQILTAEPESPARFQPHLDPVICAICLKAMAKNAAQRYASMRDFGKALRAYLQTGTAASQSGVGLTAAAAAARTAVSAPAPSAAPEPASFPDKIEFACPECGLPVRTPLATGGKKGKCPSCGAIVPIPESPSVAVASRPANVPPARTRPVAPPQQIDFSCPHCGNLVRSPPGAAGKKGRCPSCSRVVDIPDWD